MYVQCEFLYLKIFRPKLTVCFRRSPFPLNITTTSGDPDVIRTRSLLYIAHFKLIFCREQGWLKSSTHSMTKGCQTKPNITIMAASSVGGWAADAHFSEFLPRSSLIIES
jgi:hypothetical protein